MPLRFDNSIRLAEADAIISRAGSGALIHIYQGTQPATGGGSAAGSLLLGTPTVPGAFGTRDSSALITLGAVTQDSAADNSGNAQWFRIMASNDTTWVMDGSIGVNGAVGVDMFMPTIVIVAPNPITMNATNTILIGNSP